MYKYILIISVLLITFSCKNGGLSYVKGTINERGTNNPIEGVCLTLDKDKYVFGYGYKESPNDKVTYSNLNGEYKIHFTRSPIARYQVKCEHPDYFTYYNDINSDNMIKHGKTAINFTLIPKAYVKLRFIKTNTNYSYVSGIFNDKVNFYSPYYYSPGTNTTYNQIPTTVYTIYGNQINTITWYVSEIGQPKSNSKIESTFFAAKGDTAIFTIQF